MKPQEAIQKYYNCFREADKEGLRSLLTHDFKHKSSHAVYNDRDAMLEEIWSEVGSHWAEDLRFFGSGPEYMVCYTVNNDEGPICSMAEYIKFDGDKIAEIESFRGRDLSDNG